MICVRQSSVGTIQTGIEGVISWKQGRWNVHACGLVGSFYILVHTDIPGNDLQGGD
jgi:hypothetical protein